MKATARLGQDLVKTATTLRWRARGSDERRPSHASGFAVAVGVTCDGDRRISGVDPLDDHAVTSAAARPGSRPSQLIGTCHHPAMQPPRILVVDDEAPIVDLVRGYLEREGFAVESAADGPSAVEAVRTSAPDVVVLDVMLPGLDGIEVCRQIRTFSNAYVLMLTARGEEIDRIMGLTVGADDYLVKPFSPRELVARVKALLRRPLTPAEPASAIPTGLDLDSARRLVRVDGTAVDVTALEFDLLAVLVRDPGVVIGRQALLDRVWGSEFVADDHLVDVHIGNLRKKLGDDPTQPRFIETVRGVGYRLREGA
jgi:DNA-binding response OmpR family regulator